MKKRKKTTATDGEPVWMVVDDLAIVHGTELTPEEAFELELGLRRKWPHNARAMRIPTV